MKLDIGGLQQNAAIAAVLIIGGYLFFTFTEPGKMLLIFVRANFPLILAFIAISFAIYLYLRQKTGVNWIPPECALHNAFTKGILRRMGSDEMGFYSHPFDFHKVEGKLVYLFVGRLTRQAMDTSVTVAGTNESGVCEDGFHIAVQYGHTTVQKMNQKELGMKEKIGEALRTLDTVKKTTEEAKEASP